MNGAYQVRECKEDDLETVFLMLEKLSRSDNMNDRFHLTLEDLKTHVFGETPEFRCFVAEFIPDPVSSGELSADCKQSYQLVGTVLYSRILDYMIGFQCYIQGLFVEQEHRRSGVGRKLIQRLLQVGRLNGCKEGLALIRRHNIESNGLFRCFGSYNLTKDYDLDVIASPLE